MKKVEDEGKEVVERLQEECRKLNEEKKIMTERVNKADEELAKSKKMALRAEAEKVNRRKVRGWDEGLEELEPKRQRVDEVEVKVERGLEAVVDKTRRILRQKAYPFFLRALFFSSYTILFLVLLGFVLYLG